jgi:hypothetical protein|tara:strand:- start:230 stop:352 length:123 start_codon:yes stop_codon:yes gene_type:complete
MDFFNIIRNKNGFGRAADSAGGPADFGLHLSSIYSGGTAA